MSQQFYLQCPDTEQDIWAPSFGHDRLGATTSALTLWALRTFGSRHLGAAVLALCRIIAINVQ